MLSSIGLFAFRNYQREAVLLEPGVNLFLGSNAQGKTNLLEAIQLAATGRSPRAALMGDMVMWEELGGRVALAFTEAGELHQVEIRLQRDARSPRTKRTMTLDGKAISPHSFAGRVKVVSFHPEDMGLIRGSGEGRRRLLNNLMSQAESGYARLLSRYSRVLEQRNRLLKRVAQEREPADTLRWWTEEIARLGGELVATRRVRLRELAPVVARRHRDIAGGEELELRYAPNVDGEADPAGAIAAELIGRLDEELARGVTAAGPHRDDLKFSLGGVAASVHASQGQQRTAILAFKLAEVEILSVEGASPVLLFDDVMSELDAPRRAHLLELIETSPQAVITSAEESYFPRGFVTRVSTRRVVGGRVSPL